jgi:negative regulator of replication initiation
MFNAANRIAEFALPSDRKSANASASRQNIICFSATDILRRFFHCQSTGRVADQKKANKARERERERERERVSDGGALDRGINDSDTAK